MDSYIQLGKLELWISKGWLWKFHLKGQCGCHLHSFGFVGFTWLSEECK